MRILSASSFLLPIAALGSFALLPVLAREFEGAGLKNQINFALSETRLHRSLEPNPDHDAFIDLSLLEFEYLPFEAFEALLYETNNKNDFLPSSFEDDSAELDPESTPLPPPPEVVHVSTGEASWYGPGFFGNRTANGEVFRRGTMTAAHRTLPFGTKVRVTNLWNGKTAVVRINDRGPFTPHRVIDLAHGAAHHLGLAVSGIAQVRLEVLR